MELPALCGVFWFWRAPDGMGLTMMLLLPLGLRPDSPVQARGNTCF